MAFFPTEEPLLSEFYGAQLRGNFSAESHDGGCVGKCPLQFAARCRAWAKQQFAEKEGRESSACYLEPAKNISFLPGDKVMLIKGATDNLLHSPGSTGVVVGAAIQARPDDDRHIFVDFSRGRPVGQAQDLSSPAARYKGNIRLRRRGEALLAQIIAEVFDEADEGRSDCQHMTLPKLLARLAGKGLLLKQGKAGKEQRKRIRDLAVEMLKAHHAQPYGFELFCQHISGERKNRLNTEKRKKAAQKQMYEGLAPAQKQIWESGSVPGEPTKKSWPRCFDNEVMTFHQEVKQSGLFLLPKNGDQHKERYHCSLMIPATRAIPPGLMPGCDCCKADDVCHGPQCKCRSEYQRRDYQGYDIDDVSFYQGENDFMFERIVQPAFARAVCAALSLSPLKLSSEMALSFAMGSHVGLGVKSKIFGLPNDLIKRIFDLAQSFDSFSEAQHFGRVVFEHDDPFIRLSPLALASPDTFAELDSAHPTFVLIKSSKVNMELPRDDFSVRDLNVDRVNAEEIEQLQTVVDALELPLHGGIGWKCVTTGLHDEMWW